MSIFSKSLVLIFLFFYPSISYAYLDPGNMAFVIQLIVGFLAGCLFYLKKPIVFLRIFIKIIMERLQLFIGLSKSSKSHNQNRQIIQLFENRNSMLLLYIGSTLVIIGYLLMPIIPKSAADIFSGYSPYMGANLASLGVTILINGVLLIFILHFFRAGIFRRTTACIYLGLMFSVLLRSALETIDMSWEWMRDLIWHEPSDKLKIGWFLLLPSIWALLMLNNSLFNKAPKALCAFGLGLILILGWRLSETLSVTHFASWDQHYGEFSNDRERKVVWITFDEFDPEIAFSKEILRTLPNFRNMLAQSINAKKNASPANFTRESISAVITGRASNGMEIHGTARAFQKIPPDKGEKILLGYENSIFQRVADLERSSHIIGFGLPYCEIFSQVSCKAFYTGIHPQWYLGALKVFAHPKMLEYLGIGKAPGSSDYENITARSIEALEEYLAGSLASLSFIHLNFPHLPGRYAESYYSVASESEMEEYLLNLRLTDEILGRIIARLTDNNVGETLIILNSDHWLRRLRPNGYNTVFPTLLLAKTSSDNEKIEIEVNTSSINISDLIIQFFQNELTSHRELADFYSRRPYVESYLAK